MPQRQQRDHVLQGSPSSRNGNNIRLVRFLSVFGIFLATTIRETRLFHSASVALLLIFHFGSRLGRHVTAGTADRAHSIYFASTCEGCGNLSFAFVVGSVGDCAPLTTTALNRTLFNDNMLTRKLCENFLL